MMAAALSMMSMMAMMAMMSMMSMLLRVYSQRILPISSILATNRLAIICTTTTITKHTTLTNGSKRN
jgi:hypothetical protein